MAMGVLVDPSFAFPLPIFGINYLDFEFRGRPDTQFALLFGGVLAAGNLQRPKLGGTPLDASLDFFAIAAPASDRLHTPAGERESERLLTWPLSAGATTVTVQGVITQKVRQRTSSGGTNYGIFLQNTAATADAGVTWNDEQPFRQQLSRLFGPAQDRLADLRARGFSRAIIAWTDATEYYRRVCGAVVGHRFIAMTKP